jgi:hypothetical protein
MKEGVATQRENLRAPRVRSARKSRLDKERQQLPRMAGEILL